MSAVHEPLESKGDPIEAEIETIETALVAIRLNLQSIELDYLEIKERRDRWQRALKSLQSRLFELKQGQLPIEIENTTEEKVCEHKGNVDGSGVGFTSSAGRGSA